MVNYSCRLYGISIAEVRDRSLVVKAVKWSLCGIKGSFIGRGWPEPDRRETYVLWILFLTVSKAIGVMKIFILLGAKESKMKNKY